MSDKENKDLENNQMYPQKIRKWLLRAKQMSSIRLVKKRKDERDELATFLLILLMKSCLKKLNRN